MVTSLPDYKNLDLSGESAQAAARMEARAQEPASQEMFTQLVAPLLGPQVRSVLELGCGTAALARRIAFTLPRAQVFAVDKSTGMLGVARHLCAVAGLERIRLAQWDALDEGSFPFPTARYDLIVSSVVIPYFDDAQSADLIARLAARLVPGGVLAFIEQDWDSDAVYFPPGDLPLRVLNKAARSRKQSLGLGLRPMLRRAGLDLLARRSFLWTDDAYGAYTRDLLERFADAAAAEGRLAAEESAAWKRTLLDLAAAGDFYYAIVYHLIAARRSETRTT